MTQADPSLKQKPQEEEELESLLATLSPMNRAKERVVRTLMAEEPQSEGAATSVGTMTHKVAHYSRQCKDYVKAFSGEYPRLSRIGLKTLEVGGIALEGALIVGSCAGPQGLFFCLGSVGFVAANHSGLTGQAFDQLNRGVAWGLEQGGAPLMDAQEVAPWLSGGVLMLTGGKAVKLTSSSFGKQLPKQLMMDYSSIEAAYSLRIDPLTFRGPMAVDSRLFSKADSYTKLGAPKNQLEFWKMWDSKYPGTISTKNIEFISMGRAPRVDEHWIKNFPEHKNYLGQIIEHHHLDHGFLTVPLPEKLHRGQNNYLVWHNLGEKIK